MITAKMLINESGMNEKIETLALKEEIKKLAAKAELKAQEDKILKLQTYYLSICIGQNYFVNDGAQLYLILQPLYYTLKKTWWYWKSCYHKNLKVCLSLHYNGAAIVFVNVTKIYQFKAKDSEIKKYPFYLGNIARNLSAKNIKKQDQMCVVRMFCLL